MKEAGSEIILKEVTKKNLLFNLARLLYAAHQQKVSSWTGFNIMVHNKDAIIANKVGYLPTINAPASDVSTVNGALNRSFTIMRALHLTTHRGVRVHKPAYEAFMRVVLEGFYPWLNESHPEDSRQVQTCLDEIGTLADELSKKKTQSGSQEPSFSLFF